MKVFITGGAGYVGSALVPHLANQGHEVTVFDTFWYKDFLSTHPKIQKIVGDIRDKDQLISVARDHDAFIHLACISNDESFNFDPRLGTEINFNAFSNVVAAAKQNKGGRFIYASSSSIYGVKPLDVQVTEEASAEPITDYSTFKWKCEQMLREERGIDWVIVRPATVCGYAPRLRLDLMVNSFTISALERGSIPIRGGTQMRANLHVRDMVHAYDVLLHAPSSEVTGQAFNIGVSNLSLTAIAEQVQRVLPQTVINYAPSTDDRSYQVNSDKISARTGFCPTHTVQQAIESIIEAHQSGAITNGLTDDGFYNLRRLKSLGILNVKSATI